MSASSSALGLAVGRAPDQVGIGGVRALGELGVDRVVAGSSTNSITPAG